MPVAYPQRIAEMRKQLAAFSGVGHMDGKFAELFFLLVYTGALTLRR